MKEHARISIANNKNVGHGVIQRYLDGGSHEQDLSRILCKVWGVFAVSADAGAVAGPGWRDAGGWGAKLCRVGDGELAPDLLDRRTYLVQLNGNHPFRIERSELSVSMGRGCCGRGDRIRARSGRHLRPRS